MSVRPVLRTRRPASLAALDLFPAGRTGVSETMMKVSK